MAREKWNGPKVDFMRAHGKMTRHAGRESSNRTEPSTSALLRIMNSRRENSFQQVDAKFTKANLKTITSKAKANFKK